ncbi:MAG: PilZ domain-containing protein [Thermodesulfobacteriota bacterium]
MEIEKRKNIRFLVQDNVILALQNGFNRVGKVKDISMGGLSFEHIYDEDLNWVDSRKNISLWVNEFNLSKIPCRIVYDIPLQIPPEYDSLTIHLPTRRCGLQFEALTEHQIAQLDFFLTTYTKGRV